MPEHALRIPLTRTRSKSLIQIPMRLSTSYNSALSTIFPALEPLQEIYEESRGRERARDRDKERDA